MELPDSNSSQHAAEDLLQAAQEEPQPTALAPKPVPVLGVGEAACAEEVTHQSALEGEPKYGRYGTIYAHRERDKHKECLY